MKISPNFLALAAVMTLLATPPCAQASDAVSTSPGSSAHPATTSSPATMQTPGACCGAGMPRAMMMLSAASPASAVSSAVTSRSAVQAVTTSTSLATSSSTSAPEPAPPGMAWIPGGQFEMGTTDTSTWPAERPAHPVIVDGFWMDKTEVTNEDFAKFVAATNYVTTAETTPSLEDIMAQVPPGTPPPPEEALVPGGLVFTPPDHPVQLNDESQWWKWVAGASWKHPEGPDSTIAGREKHPVVMVSWYDAQEYARWAGKRLPTEAEWERAARGGMEGQEFIWGHEFQPGGKLMANVWQGEFPNHNTQEDGYLRTSPVAQFPPNGYGLYDMGGNVWEWCQDWFDIQLYSKLDTTQPTINPRGPKTSNNPNHPYQQEKVIRGGSFLCHYSYCSSYRPSARLGNTPDTGMSHVGFRLVKSPNKP